MSQKLLLQWNDFKDNLNGAVGRFRGHKDFTDVTLACEDGQQMEAHKVILAASSPFFEKILEKIRHPHPFIYLRGFQSRDLVAVLDFLYSGEANVFQEHLGPFLLIAKELEIKGLIDQIYDGTASEEQGQFTNIQELFNKTEESFEKSATTDESLANNDIKPNPIDRKEYPKVVPFNNQSLGDPKELNQVVKSLMVKSQNRIPNGTNSETRWAFICKVCGKEGRANNIQDHIEVNHLDGIAIPCDICGKTFRSRKLLGKHRFVCLRR